MPIKATCQCGAQFMAKDELAGQVVKCPTCGKAFQVPRAVSSTPHAPSTPAGTYPVACNCGRTYQVPPSMAGKPVSCNACGRQFVVPQPPAAMRPRPAAPAPTPQPFAGAGPLDNLGDMSAFGGPLGGALPAASPMPQTSFPAGGYGMAAPAARPRKKSRLFKTSTIVSILVGSLVVLAIIGIGAAAFMYLPLGFGYRSPQAVWEAQKKAIANKDWKTVYNTYTPETREQMVGAVAMVCQMVAMQDSGMAEILKKHGAQTAGPAPDLSSPNGLAQVLGKMQEQMKSAGNSIKDKDAFFAEATAYLMEKGEAMRKQVGGQGMSMSNELKELKDVVVEGDKAHGTQTYTVNGTPREMPVEFRKVEGSWLISGVLPSGSP